MAPKLDKNHALIIAALAAGVYIFFVLRPILSVAAKSSAQAAIFKKKLASAEYDIAKMGELKEKLDRLKARASDFESKLVAQENVNVLLEELSDMALASQVSIIGVKPQKPEIKSNEPYGGIPISIEAKGGYHSLGAFINRLEFSKHYLTVREIRIEGQENEPKNHICKLTVVAYASAEKK